MTPPGDGGPAFPRPANGPEYTASQCGMTLREWYAGQALAGIVSNQGQLDGQGKRAIRFGVEAEVMIAATAVKMADSLLAELRKGGAQ